MYNHVIFIIQLLVRGGTGFGGCISVYRDCLRVTGSRRSTKEVHRESRN